MTAFLALISHWRRHPLQLAMLLLGLALATALWSGVQAINAEARAAYARAAGVLGQDRLDRLTGPLTVERYAALRRAGWPVAPTPHRGATGSSAAMAGSRPSARRIAWKWRRATCS